MEKECNSFKVLGYPGHFYLRRKNLEENLYPERPGLLDFSADFFFPTIDQVVYDGIIFHSQEHMLSDLCGIFSNNNVPWFCSLLYSELFFWSGQERFFLKAERVKARKQHLQNQQQFTPIVP